MTNQSNTTRFGCKCHRLLEAFWSIRNRKIHLKIVYNSAMSIALTFSSYCAYTRWDHKSFRRLSQTKSNVCFTVKQSKLRSSDRKRCSRIHIHICLSHTRSIRFRRTNWLTETIYFRHRIHRFYSKLRIQNVVFSFRRDLAGNEENETMK